MTARLPAGGFYFDSVRCPLAAAATPQEIDAGRLFFEAFDWPAFLDEDYDDLGRRARQLRQTPYAVVANLALHLFADQGWPEGLLLVLAAASILASTTRQLPGQNVILASGIIAVLGGGAHLLGALTSVPFGPYTYTARIGQPLVPPLPWALPFVWIVFILAARGAARLVLRPRRQRRNYGVEVIGLTALLTVLLYLGLEPYAAIVQRYWIWSPTKLPSNWYTAPWVNFLGWGLVTLLILAFVTPALLNKKPVKFPPDYPPLVLWSLIQILFLTGAALHHLWPAVILISAQCALVPVLAVRGGRTAADQKPGGGGRLPMRREPRADAAGPGA